MQQSLPFPLQRKGNQPTENPCFTPNLHLYAPSPAHTIRNPWCYQNFPLPSSFPRNRAILSLLQSFSHLPIYLPSYLLILKNMFLIPYWSPVLHALFLFFPVKTIKRSVYLNVSASTFFPSVTHSSLASAFALLSVECFEGHLSFLCSWHSGWASASLYLISRLELNWTSHRIIEDLRSP